MPLATEPVNFTWSLPSLTCRHGITPQDTDLRGEFFQKVKETKTTLDRIYLSSLNREKAIIYDYEKWARKGGNTVEKKSDTNSLSYSTKHRLRPEKGPIRPLGVDNRKIEAALHCGLWNDVKQKKSSVKMPHIMARVQCYDFDDDYQSDTEKVNQQGSEYTLDSSRVFRVMQEETREKANQRLKKGKCGSWKLKKHTRQSSPSVANHLIDPMTNHMSESEDEYTSSEIRVTIEEEVSKRRGGIVARVTHKQKLDFSTIKKRGVTQNDTVDYRLPKLNSKPIIKEVEEVPDGDVVKLPLLEGVKTRSSADKKKRSKHCKKLSKHRRKKKSAEKHDVEESVIQPNIDDDIETELSLETSTLTEVSNKLSDISRGGSDLNSDKTSKPKLFCKKGIQEDALTDYPFMTMGIDELSSDEECLCDDCLATMSLSRQPALDEKPMKSILTPRQRKRTSSTGSGKGVTFAGTEKLENIRLISPLAVRNENMKRFEEEDRRERLNQRDRKRRERRRRELERFAALNQKSTKRKEARYKAEDNSNNSASMQVGPETTPPSIFSCEESYNGISQGKTVVRSNDDDGSSAETQAMGQNINKDVSSESPSLDEANNLDNDRDNDTQIPPPSPDSKVHEVEALMLDPQDGRLYEDTVLEKGDGKITVAQLGYRIKSIFNRDLPHPSSPQASSSPPNEPEVSDHDNQNTSQSDDKEDEKDEPFVTKCVDWNETTESASTSRSQTPVEKEDISDFIMSMKNCRYIRWSKGYADMLEKMQI